MSGHSEAKAALFSTVRYSLGYLRRLSAVCQFNFLKYGNINPYDVAKATPDCRILDLIISSSGDRKMPESQFDQTKPLKMVLAPPEVVSP